MSSPGAAAVSCTPIILYTLIASIRSDGERGAREATFLKFADAPASDKIVRVEAFWVDRKREKVTGSSYFYVEGSILG